MNKNLYRKLIIGFGLGIVVSIGLALYGDIQEVGHLLQAFQWSLIPAVLGLTLVNYFLRGVRFHFYLGQIGIRNISFWTSFRVFIGGFALTVTPGKVGELIRVLWLKNLTGADPARVAPATIVDRIADGLAMAILASLGALVYPQYRLAVILILAIIVSGIIISQIRPLALWLLNFGERLPILSKSIHHLHTLYENTYELLRFKNLVVGVGIGLISWSAEGVAFYLVLLGLNIANSFNLALLAIFTLSLGSILGGVSSMPGGLGAAEASMTGMLQLLVGLADNVAATATLLIRFFTLWFAVALGILAIAIWRKMLFGEGPVASSTTAPDRPPMHRRWDHRYAALPAKARIDPTPFVATCLPKLPGRGRALDIAAGAGRHTIALARRGLQVDAVDISWQGLRLAQQRAREAHLSPGEQIHFIVADVERPWLPHSHYEVILVSFFLCRPLFPLIKERLLPGGWLVYETFTVVPEDASYSHPMRREFLLEWNELKDAFSDFEILFYDENNYNDKPAAQLLARKPLGKRSPVPRLSRKLKQSTDSHR